MPSQVPHLVQTIINRANARALGQKLIHG